MACSCSCEEVGTLYFSCSGAADVGELSDRMARRLHKAGKGKMYCLAGVVAGVPGMLESARAARTRVVIDGCSVACGRKAFEKAGLEAVIINLGQLGYVKGQTDMTEETVLEAVGKVKI